MPWNPRLYNPMRGVEPKPALLFVLLNEVATAAAKQVTPLNELDAESILAVAEAERRLAQTDISEGGEIGLAKSAILITVSLLAAFGLAYKSFECFDHMRGKGVQGKLSHPQNV